MTIETDRLLLRSPEEARAESVTAYVLRNRAFLREYDALRPEEYYTEGYQAEQLKRQALDWAENKSCRFYLSPKENAALVIGNAGLAEIVMGAFCSCYLSYQMDRDHLNRGLMTEAVEAVVRFGFDTLLLHRIEGNVMPRNLRSIRVLEKCGFAPEGLAQKYLKINGVWEDHLHYVRFNPAMA